MANPNTTPLAKACLPGSAAGRPSVVDYLPATTGRCEGEDSHSDIWIATVGEGQLSGLSRWTRNSGALQHYTDRDGLPPFDRFYVSSFAEDRAGNVWIGFSGDGGLVRYTRGRFERFGPDHGVPSGAIRNLVVDASDRLWGASIRGLLRVDGLVAKRPAFSRYTTAQGLSSNEVSAVVEPRRG